MVNFRSLKPIFSAYKKDDSGATAIEYGLIVAIMAIGAIVAFQALSDQLDGQLDAINNAFRNAVNQNIEEAGGQGLGDNTQ